MKQLLTKCWMVVLVAILAVPLKAQTISVQVDESGGLWDALEAQGVTDFSTVKSLTVTGTLGTPDFQLIKNLMTGLESVDLAGTDITEVPDRVFYERASLHTCRLPQGIVRIQNYVFERCYALSTLTFGNQEAAEGRIVFPASLRYIGGESFNECRLLTHLDFTACTALEGLAWNAFSSCYGLQQVLFPSQGSFGLGGSCFAFDTGTADEYGYGQSLQEVALTKAVTRLEGHCLPNRLKRLYVESVTPSECNDDAFDNIEKENLTIYVPKGCKRLYAVANGWTKVYTRMQELGFKLNVSGYGAVQKGNGTYTDGDVCFPNSNDATTLKAVPELGCELVSVTLDGNALSVDADGTFTIPAETTTGTLDVTFSTNLLTVDNPNGGELYSKISALDLNPKTIRALKVTGTMKERDWQTVRSLIALQTLDLTQTDITVVPDEAMEEHKQIREVLLPLAVTEIGDRAFQNCSALQSYPIGDNVVRIGYETFYGCSGIITTTLVLPSSLQSVGNMAFYNGSSSLKAVDMSQCQLTSELSYYVFDGNVENIKLPQQGHYRLDYHALENARIKELTIPGCVTEITSGALPSALQTLYVQGTTVIPASSDAFNNISNGVMVYVPTGLSVDYQFAGGWSRFQNIIEHGFLVKTNGHGVVCSGGNDYQNGSICFPTIGQTTTLQVVPDAGYEIGAVTLDGAAVALDADGTFTIPATTVSATIEVTFTNKQLEVAVTMEGNGSYTINGQTYTAATTLVANGGDVVALQLQPATGYFVKQVTINGKDVALKNGGLEVTTRELDENTSIAITFSNDASSVATVNFQQDGFGAVNYGGETFEDGAILTVDKGKNLTLEFVPNGDSNLLSLVVNGTDVTADVSGNAYTLSNITANATVKTSFFSPNMITVNNPNGGELKDLIAVMGSTPATIRTLKVVGKMSNKDWNYVMSTMSRIETFDISETNVTGIPEQTFCDHQYLTTVHLPSTVTTFNSYAFQNCQQLTVVDGCENVEEINECVFRYCTKLANFPFGNKIRVIQSSAFDGCTSLPRQLVMPASLTSLGWSNVFNGSSVRIFDLSQCSLNCNFAYNAFGQCTSLLLPEKGDYQMNEHALEESQLTELRLPAALSGINNDHVMPATLERLFMARTEPVNVSGNDAFVNIDFDNCTLYVPVGSKDAYSEAKGWAQFLHIQECGFMVKTGGFGMVRYEANDYKNGELFFPPMGEALTMQIVPSPGYELATLKVNGAAFDYADDGTFTVPATLTGGNIEATFTNKQLEVVVTMEGNGSYTISGQTYTAATTLAANGGDVVALQLQPATGYLVKQVTINGENVVLKNGGIEVATKELDENTAIAITFSNDASSVATVTFQQDGFGAVNYGGETFEDGATLTVVKGKNLTLEIIPNGDSNLQSLTVNDVDVTADVADNNYVLNNVTANTTVKTSFFSPNMITVNNPNGGELKDLIVAMGSNSRTIRTLKVVGKLNNKDWAFVTSNLSRIEVFDISETNVKSVPESAFRDHQYLTIVHLPSTVATINSWAFYNCQQLTTVNGCDNVEEIRECAFSDCSKLSNFPFGSKLRSLSSAVFNNCTSLPKALVMPASLTSLGWDNVFNGSSVRTFDLSQCTLSCDLAYNTFGECTSLQLPERGDYRLGYSSMSNAKFKELRLPAALSYIYGEDVLPETLERLYVTRSKPIEVADNISFRKIDFDKCALYVPIGSMEAYSEAPRWAEFTKVVESGLKVTVGEQGKLRADGQTLMGTSTFFPQGAVTFTITPNAGWHADAVTLNDVAIPFANNQFTLNADQLTGNLTVTFAINQFNLNLQIAGEGKVKLGSLVYTTDQVLPADSLSKLNFTLEPAEGLVVSGITFNGKESVVQNGGANYVTPAIVANSTLTIAFGASGALGDVVTYDVTTGENGTVEYLNTSLLPQTTIQVKKGVDAVFTIKPDDYYVIEKVTIDGNDVTGQVDADGLLTLTDVSGDATLEVTFVMNSHIVIALEKGVRLNNALTDAQKQVVTKLTVTGQLWEEDYYTMRDKMPLLAEVDLSKVDVSNMNYVPYKAFCVTEGWDSSVGKTSLESIRLPEGIRYISDWAFSGCGNLKEVNFAELNKLEGLGARAFGWTALNAVDLSQTKMTSLGSEFYKVKGLENVKLPKTISSLGDVFTESGLMEVDLSGCTELKTLDGTFRNSKKLEKVVLPEGLTAINGAFSECNALTTVNFPKSLQSIGSDAFNNTSLQAVDLSGCSQLVSIGWGAFRDSRGLGAVLLPASLQLLGENAFYNTVITTIDLSNTQVQDIKESTFNECRQLENIKLPANLKTIGNSAFANCEKVAGMIELPATVVSVGETAFWGTQVPVVKCHTATPPAITSNSFGDKWEAAFVPEGCAEVYKSAEIWEDKVILDHEVHAEVTVSFEGNLANDIVEQAQIAPAQVTHLKVHGPLGAKDFAIMRSNMTLLYDLDMEDAECSMIPENAFLDKKVLMNVKLPSELIAIQESAFRGCSSLKGTLTLPVGLTTIGWAAFQGCSSLEKVELSPALEVIRGYAFEGCASLQQPITFPQNFTSLGEYAFANCRNLTGTVKFNTEFYMFMGNEGYWSSTGRAFENCSNIETVDMSDCEYLYQLPQGVFAGCTSLNTVMLPPYLERIEGYGFENDVNLLNITFPESLMYIDGGAFRNCSSLQRVDLSGCDNFGTIGDYAFADCALLEAVSLPASVNWIQGYAFSECRKLAEFNVEALEPADLGEYVFRHVHTERCVLSIPTGTYSDYLSAPQWGEFVSMRKAIDVALDEGASLTYSSGTGGVAGARGTHRAPSAEGQQGKVNVKDGSSLYVAENDNVTFYINPDENVSIKRVLFNGEDVTGQLQANAFVTPGLTENTTFEVQLNVDGPITVKELRITENEVGLKEAESIQLKATVYPTNATDKTIVWTSADESIARVSSEGVITGVAPGRTTITAKTNDGGLTKVIDIVIISNDYFITLAESYDTFVETGLQIPMLMHNADAAKGIQFDVYLPEGLDMENNGGSFNVSMTGRSNGHAVTTARRSDGSIRVMVFSQEGNSFFENDGELLSLPIITLEEAGEYEVQVKNIHISGPKSFDFTAPDYVCRVKVKDFPLGDSNGDGAVSISDVTNTVNQAMEQFQWVERFKMKPGDVNSDGIITVTDVSATAAILMGRDPFAASRAMAKTVCHDGLTLETVSVNADGRGVVELRLDNLSNYTGMQCDLFLPAGLKVACDDSGKPMVNLCEDQLGSHVLVANAVSNGAMRIMAVSMTDKPFAASETALVRIAVEADDMAIGGQYTVSVDNATIVNASTHIGYEIPAVTALVNFESGLTPVHFAAIDGMEVRAEGHQLIIWSPEAANISLVSVDGTSRILQLRAGENRVNVSNAGVYILNNRKVIIR